MHRRATFKNKVSRKPSPDRNRAAREEELKPDLEVVQIGRAESFKAWEHGYPFRTVRWHFHPEYEIHYVVDTTGHFFVGDFIGAFEPGNLVLTGPNLPHNWVSDIAPGAQVAVRSRVVQFTEGFIGDAMALIPELACFRDTLERSRRGVLFGRETSAEVMPLLRELVGVRGIRRVEVFLGVIGALNRAGDARTLTSASYLPDPSGFMSTGINEALAYINDNLTEPFRETDLAAIAGLSPGAFSRSFRRHTGLALVQYVNRLRINLACQLLMGDASVKITDVCFAAGFNNISNFNRQFLVQKAMSPSRFRALLMENQTSTGAGEEDLRVPA
jgi:AraC-like DNA-binding protein